MTVRASFFGVYGTHPRSPIDLGQAVFAGNRPESELLHQQIVGLVLGWHSFGQQTHEWTRGTQGMVTIQGVTIHSVRMSRGAQTLCSALCHESIETNNGLFVLKCDAGKNVLYETVEKTFLNLK